MSKECDKPMPDPTDNAGPAVRRCDYCGANLCLLFDCGGHICATSSIAAYNRELRAALAEQREEIEGLRSRRLPCAEAEVAQKRYEDAEEHLADALLELAERTVELQQAEHTNRRQEYEDGRKGYPVTFDNLSEEYTRYRECVVAELATAKAMLDIIIADPIAEEGRSAYFGDERDYYADLRTRAELSTNSQAESGLRDGAEAADEAKP